MRSWGQEVKSQPFVCLRQAAARLKHLCYLFRDRICTAIHIYCFYHVNSQKWEIVLYLMARTWVAAIIAAVLIDFDLNSVKLVGPPLRRAMLSSRTNCRLVWLKRLICNYVPPGNSLPFDYRCCLVLSLGWHYDQNYLSSRKWPFAHV